MAKKAQLTVFIILGIALLLMVALVIFMRMRSTTSPLQLEIAKQEELTGPAKEVKDYVQQCIQEYSLQGIEIIGLQGGYIYLPEGLEKIDVESNKRVLHNGETIKIIDGSGKNDIPYWLTEDTVAVPSKRFMEKQLERYIVSNVPKCADFSVFKARGFSVSTGTISANVSFGQQAVIDVKWETSVDYNGKNYRFQDYNSAVPVNLMLIQKVAMDLSTFEIANTYLESHAKSLISLYSYTGGKKAGNDLPPMTFSDTNTDCSFVSWTKQETETKLKQIFAKYFPYLKIAKTHFERITSSDPISQGVYDSFIKDYFPETPSIGIDFSYSPGWQMDLAIKPSSGDYITPERTSQSSIPFLPNFCVFTYRFKYSIKSPVLVKISDSKSARINANTFEAEKGFDFYFPMKLYLCGNQNRQCTGRNPYDNANLTALFGYNVTSHIYDCSDLGAEISLTTTNDSGFLPSVDVTQICADKINECYLGTTDANGYLKVKMPKCDRPQLRVARNGYAGLVDDIKESYSLEKLRTYNVSVELIHAGKFLSNYYLTNGFTKSSCGKMPDQLLQETKYPLREKDDIVISVNGNSQNPVIIYPTMKSVVLGSGKYTIYTVVKGEVVIRPSEYKAAGKTEIVDFDNNPLTHEDYHGIWVLGSNNFNYTFRKEELNAKKVKFYALTEHLSDENLEVKRFDNPVIGEGQLSGKISVDENCDGKLEERAVTVDQKDYVNFIKPEFS